MELERDRTLGILEEHDVRSLQLWFTDVEGFLGSITISGSQLEGTLHTGVELDGSGVEAFFTKRGLRALPDLNTLQRLDSPEGGARAARMFCDVHLSSGEPLEADPRMVLKRNLKRFGSGGSRPS